MGVLYINSQVVIISPASPYLGTFIKKALYVRAKNLITFWCSQFSIIVTCAYMDIWPHHRAAWFRFSVSHNRSRTLSDIILSIKFAFHNILSWQNSGGYWNGIALIKINSKMSVHVGNVSSNKSLLKCNSIATKNSRRARC